MIGFLPTQAIAFEWKPGLTRPRAIWVQFLLEAYYESLAAPGRTSSQHCSNAPETSMFSMLLPLWIAHDFSTSMQLKFENCRFVAAYSFITIKQSE